VTIRKSKNGKARHVVLSEQGVTFFRRHVAGGAGAALAFTRADGSAWQKSAQGRPMRAACSAAKLTPQVSFHGLRHTWASLAVMNAVPLLVVAKNLGHTDTRMVEKHYGHLAPSFIVDAIRAGAPKFNIKEDKKVVALR
jgi:integrase